MEPEPVAQARGVLKRFGARVVLRDVDLDVMAGEVLCVTGDNGTGKSTLLKLLAGTLLPDAGSMRIGGHDSASVAARRLATTSYNDDRSWYARLSCWENLRFWLSLRGCWPGDAARLLDEAGLGHARDTRVGVLSSGQRARLGVVRALAADAPLVVLDEPTRAVDATARVTVRDMLAEAAGAGRALVVATHDEDLRDRLAARTVTLGFGPG